MRTILAKQIYARMKAKNISTIDVERKAGLKAHAVRNILRGHSNRPAVDIVQSIARILDCTVDDLLQGQNIFTEDKNVKTRDELRVQPYKTGLLAESVKFIDAQVKQGEYNLTVQQTLTCVEETYLHSLQKGLNRVDQDFAQWFLDMMK